MSCKFKDLTEQDKFYIKITHKDSSLPFQNRMDTLKEKFGVSERTVRKWISSLGYSVHKDIDNAEVRIGKIRGSDKDKKVKIITWAQNATPLHETFFSNILAYADFRDAEVFVINGKYQNPTSLFSDTLAKSEWWDPKVIPYLCGSRITLHPTIQILGDVPVVATAEDPLSGLEGMSGGKSCVVGHPRVHLRSLPVLEGHHKKLMMTTGAVTLANYTDTKVGKKGEFHHTYGFTIVEIKDNDIHYVRQVTATPEGTFTDLIYNVDGEVYEIDSAAAFIFGDLHGDSAEEEVVGEAVKFFKKVRPKMVFLHDAVDARAINHHEAKNPIAQYQKYKEGKHLIGDEINRLIKLIERHSLTKYNLHVVRSNHDCHHKDTQFLTGNGWKLYKDIGEEDLLAQFDGGYNISYAKPLARVEKFAPILYDFESPYHRQVVTPGHEIVYNNEKVCARDVSGGKYTGLPSVGYNDDAGVNMTESTIRLCSWAIADGTVVYNYLKDGTKRLDRIQFKLSKEKKINRLRELLDKGGVKYTFKPATKSGLNKLQPYYIRIYSDDCRQLFSYLEGENGKGVPEWFFDLSPEQGIWLLEEFMNNDGHTDKFSRSGMVSISEKFLSGLQAVAIQSGIPASMTEISGGSGFANGKKQYVLHWRMDGNTAPNHIAKNFKRKEVLDYNDVVYCFQMPKGTLVTRYEGKVAFSGNCFLDRWVQDSDWKKDIPNSKEYLEYTLALLDGKAPKGILPYLLDKHFGNKIKCLDLDESVVVHDFELASHGHLGANGSRGSIEVFRKLNTKMVVGHGHGSHRRDGVLMVGTNTVFREGYNHGASGWSQSDVLIHDDKKAQHLIFSKDKRFTTIEY